MANACNWAPARITAPPARLYINAFPTTYATASRMGFPAPPLRETKAMAPRFVVS